MPRTNSCRWRMPRRERVDVTPPAPARAIVLACDETYAMPLATTLRSLVDSNASRGPLEIYVLADDISAASRKRVCDSLPNGSAVIHWKPVELDQFAQLSTLSYISKMTFARFLIPQLLPSAVARVLYLDVDVLVLSDLEQLWTVDLNGRPVGAVLDNLDVQIRHGKPGVEAILARVPRVERYFNAGVLLIDVERWRRERVSERALDYLSHNPETPFADQDALNVACDERWQDLGRRWNFQDHVDVRLDQLPARDRPGIVHFVTSKKPWKPASFSLNAAFYDAFRSKTHFRRNRHDRCYDALLGLGWRLRTWLRERLTSVYAETRA